MTGTPERRYTTRMLATFACQRKYEIEHERGWRRAGRGRPPHPPTLKKLLAEMMRCRDHLLAKSQTQDFPMFLQSLCAEWNTAMWEAAGNPRSYDAEAIRQIAEEAVGIMEHYHQIHTDDRPQPFMRVKAGLVSPPGASRRATREIPFVDRLVEVRLPNAKGKPSMNRLVVHIDGVLDGQHPTLLVHHYTSNRDPEDVRSELLLRQDILAQAWAVEQILGKPVQSVMWDVVRTKVPSTPKLVKCRRCKGTGKVPTTERDGILHPAGPCSVCQSSGIGGLSKSPCDTTVSVWEQTVERFPHLDLEQQREIHGELLRTLDARGQTFAYRVYAKQIPAGATSQWALDASETVRQILTCRKRKLWPRNPGVCVGRAGPCPYREPCLDFGQHGEDRAWYGPAVDPYPGEWFGKSAARKVMRLPQIGGDK